MLQLVQQYVMLTHNEIITDVCQREHQGPEDTTFTNGSTSAQDCPPNYVVGSSGPSLFPLSSLTF